MNAEDTSLMEEKGLMKIKENSSVCISDYSIVEFSFKQEQEDMNINEIDLTEKILDVTIRIGNIVEDLGHKLRRE